MKSSCHFWGAIMGLLLTSCTKSYMDVVKDNTICRDFFVSFLEDASKTSINSDRTVNWCNGDAILFYDIDNGAVRKHVITEDCSTAQMTTYLEEDATYLIAAYGGNSISEKSGMGFTLSGAIMPVQDGSFGNSHIAAAKVDLKKTDDAILFRNITSIFKFSLHRDDIRKVIFSSSTGEKIHGNGTIKFTFDEEGEPNASFGSTGGNSVVLNIAGPGEYYIATLPTSLENGFIISFYDDNILLMR